MMLSGFVVSRSILKKNYEPRNKLLTYWSAQRKDQVENEVKVTDLII